MSDIPILGGPLPPQPAPERIEICRSFSMKVNLGNYESADFFASRKMECNKEFADDFSQELVDECFEDVRKAIMQFKKMREKRSAA